MINSPNQKCHLILFLSVVTTSTVVLLGISTEERQEGQHAFLRSFEGHDEINVESALDEANVSKLTMKRSERTDQILLRHTLPSIHLRTSEHGIPVGEALDSPLCPPPPMTRSLGICYMEKCTTHHECSTGTACCFNGCIHTCIEPMDRPAAFDWTEDSSKILPILDMDFEESPHLFYPILVVNQPNSKYAAAEGGEELIHLPGGCFVSASRYQKLKEFMKAPSIKECRCNDGEVVCDVRAEQTATTEELF